MVYREFKIPLKNSFFLFGARGTGKTTLLHKVFSETDTHFIDLLDLEQEERFLRDPEILGRIVDDLPSKIIRVVIDEVQKAPRLLDVVHRKIEEGKRKGQPRRFVMTGSSARKLRRGAANLLAGRAAVYHIYPLTATELSAADFSLRGALELGSNFSLRNALEFGTLPELTGLEEAEEKNRYLEAYARTYLKEEIWNEHIVRKLEPFAHFLEVAAQMNGKILNYTAIGRDTGTDVKTVQSYFQILEDTLLGFFVPPYHASPRKRQTTNPKFFLFDPGVKRALERTLTVPLLPRTYAFEEAFEHWVTLEIHRQNEYRKRDYRLSYIRTHDGAEIDLVIERPGKGVALVEIKSTEKVQPNMTKHLQAFLPEFKKAEAFLLSLDLVSQKIGGVRCLPWNKGLEALGL